MSRHYFDTEHSGNAARVILGYDRPLDHYFLQVRLLQNAEDTSDEWPYIYASIDDPDDTADLDYYRRTLQQLGLRVPDSLFEDVENDAADRVGNYVVQHFSDGTRQVLMPKE